VRALSNALDCGSPSSRECGSKVEMLAGWGLGLSGTDARNANSNDKACCRHAVSENIVVCAACSTQVSGAEVLMQK
jgi:hypothetical protein